MFLNHSNKLHRKVHQGLQVRVLNLEPVWYNSRGELRVLGFLLELQVCSDLAVRKDQFNDDL
jgi:hypothetical protein